MPRQRSNATPTTLYRLVGVPGLREAVRTKYLEGEQFAERACSVGDREALLVHGHISAERTKWADRVAELTGEVLEARNVTAAAVLLIGGDQDIVWAVSYGMGFLLLEQAYVDPGFGQRIAVRVADADHLNSLTRKTMDDRAKVDRSSIPSGTHLRGFGIGGFGELVTRLVATAEIPGLKVGKSFKLRGADALSIPLGHGPEALLADLAAIEEALAQPALKELEVLEQLVAVKKGSEIADRLNALLVDALSDEDAAGFAAAWPHESVDENGTPEAFIVKGKGRRIPAPGVPTAADLAGAVDKADVLGSLDRVKIQLFSDPEAISPISPDIPLRKWVAFEASLEDRRYFLHDGAWYLMDQSYADLLARRVQEIIDRRWEVELPTWPSEGKAGASFEEKDYNLLVADHCCGVLLDRRLIYTTQNRRGFEACDVLMQDGTLVHIKNLESSAPASHLFAQGHNSAHTLTSDDEARAKLRERVVQAGGDPDMVKAKPPAVVFGMAHRSGTPFSAKSLYSFSQVTLVRTVDDLEARGINVFVVPIHSD